MKKLLLFAVLVSILTSADTAWVQAAGSGRELQPQMSIELGAGIRSIDGEKTFGFQQYRVVPPGGFVRSLNFSHLADGNPIRFDFRATDLFQRDQRFAATLEDVGRQKLEFEWWSFSRYWTNRNPSVLSEVSYGRFAASAGLRQSLEAAPDNTALEALARDAVQNSPEIDIRSFRERKILDYTYNFTDSLGLRLNYLHDQRRGNRLMAQGTYSRIGVALGDTFETPGQEVFEPTRYGTNEFGVDLNFSRKKLFAGFGYRASLFNNSVGSLIWQNPFRITPAQATQPSGGLLRGRFAETQVALPPDNQAHTLTGSLMVLLPYSSKASALVSWGRWTQNEAFLPLTLNTAITANNLPSGVTPTSLAALPRSSLKGLIHNLTQDYAATTRPFRMLQLTFRYNDYDLKNLTEGILFPAYAGYGDSWWRTSISGQPGTANLPIESEPKSFHRQRAQFEGAFRPVRDLTWKSAYRWERWNREHRQVSHLTDQGLLTSLSYAPSKVFFTQAGFRYFDRKPDAYDPGTLEPSFLRMFDQAQRLRKQGDALVSVNIRPDVTLSASWFYLHDSYDKTFYGLHQQLSNSLSADATFSLGENASMYAGWGYDRAGYDYLSVAKTSFPYSFANSWSRDTRDRVHSAHFGLSGAAINGKLSYQLSYAGTLARMIINTVNPNQAVPNQVLNAQAFSFPDVKNQFHEVRLEGSYEIRPRVRLGMYYLLEPYRLGDFAKDIISPYDPDSIAPENDARRYLLLDAGPSNYTGNMIAFYLRYNAF